jgi:hypothetical protein
MLDENIWLQLTEDEKFSEIRSYLNSYLEIETGNHELCNTSSQGRLVTIKKELEDKIFKILDIENAS